MKVAFVTPRYGPEVMGGAETGARQLAEHLVARVRLGGGGLHDLCPRPRDLGRRARAGRQPLNGVTVRRFVSAAGRDPDFYGLDGRLRVAPRDATREESQRWVQLNGPVTPALRRGAGGERRADVAAFYPYLYYPTVVGIGRVPMPAVLHPAAHDEPALYLPVFRGTYSTPTPSATTRWPNAGWSSGSIRSPTDRRSSSASASATQRPETRRGRSCWVSGTGPYLVSVGRVDEHKGSAMLAAFFQTYKERHPGPLALALVGPGHARSPTIPTSCVTGHRRRGRQVGHRPRRRRCRSPLRPSSRSPSSCSRPGWRRCRWW